MFVLFSTARQSWLARRGTLGLLGCPDGFSLWSRGSQTTFLETAVRQQTLVVG